MGIEYDKSLPACPVCGKRAYISHDMPDGYCMGWSVGCSAYKMNDGIHTHKMAKFGLSTRAACVLWWNEICEDFETGQDGDDLK